jgi:hypothetical protein
MPALTVAGRQTTAPVTANNRHPESNYGRVAADDVKTQLFVQVGDPGNRTAKICDPTELERLRPSGLRGAYLRCQS